MQNQMQKVKKMVTDNTEKSKATASLADQTLPTVEQWSTPERYAVRYIARVTTQPNVERPVKQQAGEYLEMLEILHEQNMLYGPEPAAKSWKGIKPYHPQLEEQAKARRIQLMHADDLKKLTMPEYMGKYPLYKNGLNFIYGPSQNGKSFLALDMAGQTGIDDSAVYIVGEGLNGFASRWEAWKDYNKVDTSNLWFYPEALDFSDDSIFDSFISLIEDKKPKLIVVDTVARCLGHFDENSSRDMGLFIQRCDRLRTYFGASVLLVHHTGNAHQNRMRGSSALYAAADSGLIVQNTEGLITMYNDHERGGKNKYGAAWEPMHMQITSWPVGEFEGAVLVPQEKSVTDLNLIGEFNERQITIMRLVANLDGASLNDVCKGTGISRASTYRHIGQLREAGYLTNDAGQFMLTETGVSAVQSNKT